MEELCKKYLDTMDRIFLNELALKKGDNSKKLKAQLEKDYNLKRELEQQLKLS